MQENRFFVKNFAEMAGKLEKNLQLDIFNTTLLQFIDLWFDPLFSGHIFQNSLGRSIVILLSKDSPRSEFVKGNTSDDT